MKIKELRVKRNLSQADLAEKLSISRTSVYRFELGITDPGVEELKKMADIFGCSVDEIVDAKTPMLDLRKLDDCQRELVDGILKLSPNECARVAGYIKAIKE